MAEELTDEEARTIHQIYGVFGMGLTEGDDLNDAWEEFVSFFGISEEDSEWLSAGIIDCALDGLDERTIAEATEPFLLSKIWEFLQGCAEEVQDPYGNDAFNAGKYKAFDRKANRYGHSYRTDDDREARRPRKGPLQNPKLNTVAAESHSLPSVPLQEGLQSGPNGMDSYVAAIKKQNAVQASGIGSAMTSSHNLNDWKAAQQLRAEQEEQFSQHKATEFSAIRGQQLKNVSRIDDGNPISRESNQAFLNELNYRSNLDK